MKTPDNRNFLNNHDPAERMANQPYVFLVDDDPDAHFLHKRIINKRFPDAQIRCFTDGRQALKTLLAIPANGENCPSHLWLDLNMPSMDGWNFLEALAVNARRLVCKPKITIVTSSPDPLDEARALAMGIESFTQKFMSLDKCEQILASVN